MYKQCLIVLSHLYLRFAEAALHKHSLTTSTTLATVLCSVFAVNAEPERERDIRAL